MFLNHILAQFSEMREIQINIKIFKACVFNFLGENVEILDQVKSLFKWFGGPTKV